MLYRRTTTIAATTSGSIEVRLRWKVKCLVPREVLPALQRKEKGQKVVCNLVLCFIACLIFIMIIIVGITMQLSIHGAARETFFDCRVPQECVSCV